MAQFIGLDIGTQSIKALIWDADRRAVVGRGSAPMQLSTPRPGAAEQDPADWVDGMESALDEALDAPEVRRDTITAIAVSGQQHGFVALDKEDKVIRPAKLWCDTETAAEAAQLSRQLGRPIPAGFTASKVLWLAKHEPRSYAQLHCTLLPHDFINLHLAGERAMECGDASGTGWFDCSTRTFDEQAMITIRPGFAETVPPLAPFDEPIGTLRTEVAARFGLEQGKVLVAPGSGDNMMSAIGAGAVRGGGPMVVSLGTSGTLFARSEHAVLDPSGIIAPFCDALGAWLPLVCTMNCTTAAEEVKNLVGDTHRALTEAASRSPAGSHGITFLPYLAGERAPNWPHATGTVLGLTPGTLNAGTLYRAALEGATFALRRGLDALQAHGIETNELRAVGGGSKNPLWRKILAETFGVPVRVPAEVESAALGAAIQAMAVASKGDILSAVRDLEVPMESQVAEPSSCRAAYAEAFERFREHGDMLFSEQRYEQHAPRRANTT